MYRFNLSFIVYPTKRELIISIMTNQKSICITIDVILPKDKFDLFILYYFILFYIYTIQNNRRNII
jgi:hypothetical protein